MWNNYSVSMANPDKIARAEAEGAAMRLADEAAAGQPARRSKVAIPFGAVRRATATLVAAFAREARHLRHPHAPRLTAGPRGA